MGNVYNEIGRNADGTFQFDEGRLQNSANELTTYSQELHNQVVELQSVLTKIKGAWISQGEDAESFANELQKTIDKLENNIGRTVNEYGKAMNTLVDNGKNIASRVVGRTTANGNTTIENV